MISKLRPMTKHKSHYQSKHTFKNNLFKLQKIHYKIIIAAVAQSIV